MAAAVSFAEWSFGTTTASMPAASAVRRQAPRLRGSSTPSSTSNRNARPRSTTSASKSPIENSAAAATSTTTPWWTPPSRQPVEIAAPDALERHAPRQRARRSSSASLPLASRRTFAASTVSGRRSSTARTACRP